MHCKVQLNIMFVIFFLIKNKIKFFIFDFDHFPYKNSKKNIIEFIVKILKINVLKNVCENG